MLGLERAVRRSGLERSLVELIKLRASQINQCAYCIDMHWKDARHHGDTEQRLYGLSAWREAPYYSERAGRPRGHRGCHPGGHHPCSRRRDRGGREALQLRRARRRSFFTIVTINSWNRLAISSRVEPGSYTVSAGD